MNEIYNFEQQKSLTVTTLIHLIKDTLETEFINFWVQGEISNLILSSSGHYYFNLKDANSQIKCVIFKFVATSLDFNLAEGQEIELTGKITLYAPRGDLQIIVESISKLGFGKLYAKFVTLKKTLQQAGYFSDSHKKKIPKFPQKIGIITSIFSAAIKDVITTIKKRQANVEIIIYPTSVQGIASTEEIAAAINTASIRCEVDVLILCRGGGSIEDLWAFNEEIIVKSIYNCSIPIVSGIGHESDFTLADFTADLRAATPTAAAQMVTFNKDELLKMITLKEKIIFQKFKGKILETYQKLDYLSKYFLNINTFLAIKINKLNELNKNLHIFTQQKILSSNLKLNNLINLFQKKQLNLNDYTILINNLDEYLNNNVKNYLTTQKNKLDFLGNILSAISPQKILIRGFSIVKNHKGNIIKDAKLLNPGDKVSIQFAQGSSVAKIIQNNNKEDLFD